LSLIGSPGATHRKLSFRPHEAPPKPLTHTPGDFIQRSDMSPTDQTPARGFALLIKARRVERRFVPREGETIRILDKDGKELWSIKVPAPIDNLGVILHEVQIDLLTEREFGHFCQNTWTRGPSTQPPPQPDPTKNPS
jgi:hypothetical protein